MNRATALPLGDSSGLRLAIGLIALAFASPLFAGFPSTETFLPAVGRVPGQNGAQFYTTVWATNLTGSTVNFTFDFLKQGQANNSPASFSDTLTPGQTKVYENVVETKLGLQNSLGAARVTSSGEILVAERIYNQAPGDDVGKTEGLFFAGVPKAFSISLGESASIQGLNQGGSENFRYNFALVETGGGSPTVNVQLFDGNATLLGQKAYILQPYEQLQPGVADIFPGVATTNARITATVTGGSGSVLLAGAQLANESQDSSGFEMSFRDDLLGGGSGGLTAVAHDGTLVGSGTVSTPLGINPAAVVTSLNGLHGAVTLSAGSNVTLTPSGQTITIAASGGGGGLTLPFNGSASVPAGAAFKIQNPGTDGAALWGTGTGAGVYGESTGGNGVIGTSTSSWGVHGMSSGTGVNGAAIRAEGNGIGIFATNTSADATVVATNATNGVIYKGFASGGTLVFQVNSGSSSVEGDAAGINNGVSGTCSGTGIGVFGMGGIGVYGRTNGSGDNDAGYFEGNVTVTQKLSVGGDLSVGGNLTKSTGTFKIDHPLDPANKYLYHSFVESPDMMNIYNGLITLDQDGGAVISLPDWFEALNQDFRYQLTSIGTPQPGLFIAGEVENNMFAISGGAPGGRVSWQVTGIRHDAYAEAHRIRVEEQKKPEDRGKFLHPELFGHAGDPPIGASPRPPIDPR
jgi:hypothetical protein